MTSETHLPLDAGAGVFMRDATAGLLRTYAPFAYGGGGYAGADLEMIANLCNERAGVNSRDLSRRQAIIKALMTTSDFVSIIAATAGAALKAGFDAYQPTYQKFSAIGSVADFKTHVRPQLGGFAGLQVTPEGSEYQAARIPETNGSVSIQTRGRVSHLSRQLLVNDALGFFLDHVRRQGYAAAHDINLGAYAFLTSGSGANGPTLADGGQLFNTTAATTAGGHANLAGTGAAISSATLTAAKAAIRKQTDRGSTTPLGMRGRTLLVPEALAETAWTQAGVASWGTNGAVDDALVQAGRLQVVTDPLLDAVSETAWYVVADPDAAPLIETAFLSGTVTPYIDEAIDFNTEGVLFKVRLDWGYCARDYRAAFRNAGA